MPGTTIAPDATIIGGTSIGTGCAIASGATLDDCIVGDGVTIGAGAHLSHCFIAHGTEIAPGTVKSSHYLSKKLDLPISL
jgi:mannose-1-phosphate guanylyltransferase